MERLDGKVAFITGATSGIGEATAKTLAGLGAKVVVSGRRKANLNALGSGLWSRSN